MGTSLLLAGEFGRQDDRSRGGTISAAAGAQSGDSTQHFSQHPLGPSPGNHVADTSSELTFIMNLTS